MKSTRLREDAALLTGGMIRSEGMASVSERRVTEVRSILNLPDQTDVAAGEAVKRPSRSWRNRSLMHSRLPSGAGQPPRWFQIRA